MGIKLLRMSDFLVAKSSVLVNVKCFSLLKIVESLHPDIRGTLRKILRIIVNIICFHNFSTKISKILLIFVIFYRVLKIILSTASSSSSSKLWEAVAVGAC